MSAKPLPHTERLSRRHVLRAAAVACVAAGVPCSTRAAHVVRLWPAAKAVPALDLAGLDGNRWRLSSAAGQVVVLNFWATWCEPCRAEMPDLQALSTQNPDLVVLGINRAETSQQIARFAAAYGVSFPLIVDPLAQISDRYGARNLPVTIIIASDGTVAARQIGLMTLAEFQEILARVR